MAGGQRTLPTSLSVMPRAHLKLEIIYFTKYIKYKFHVLTQLTRVCAYLFQLMTNLQLEAVWGLLQAEKLTKPTQEP